MKYWPMFRKEEYEELRRTTVSPHKKDEVTVLIVNDSPSSISNQSPTTSMIGVKVGRNDPCHVVAESSKKMLLIGGCPLDADEDTKEAIADWHYWKNRGYEF